jgi:LysM repeat protein
MPKLILKATLIVILVIFGFTVNAQQLVIEGSAPRLYITHKVEAKENFYSVGRLYNVSPKEIAAYNELDIDKGLNLGATIKIPLTTQNFTQEDNVQQGNKIIPVHHIISAGEGLFRLSSNYNKVTVETLKKWNKLTNDEVKKGQYVIVGYLKTTESPAPADDKKAVENTITETASATPPNVKPDAPKVPVPAVRNPELEDNKKVETEDNPSSKTNTTRATNLPPGTPINFNGGAFKALYQDQSKAKNEASESGESGVFKSTSTACPENIY